MSGYIFHHALRYSAENWFGDREGRLLRFVGNFSK